MAETSAIEWTDATVNFWWGCRKVGPGCDHCYAEALAKRFGIPDYDSSGVRRKVEGAVKLIRRLQRTAEKFEAKHGRRRRVFIQSMSDFFDNEVDPAWRAEAWAEIVAADRLDIQLVTKRIPNVQKMIHAAQGGAALWPAHVGLIITVVNQEEADRDIPRLLRGKAISRIPWVGLSIEPMLGGIDIRPWLYEFCPNCGVKGCTPSLRSDGAEVFSKCGEFVMDTPTPAIDWVIVGGESGANARPMNPEWVIAIRDACNALGVPFLFKQWGEWSPDGNQAYATTPRHLWPNDGPNVWRIGKKAAGRELDGRTHDGFPRIAA